MGDQKKDNSGNRHIRGRGVWIPTELPKDLQDLIVNATSSFFDEQKQKGSSIEQTEKAAKLYLSAFDVKEGDPEIMAIMRDTIQAMIDDGLQLMRTAAILDELQPYIEAELKRPEYDGFDTLHDILEAYHNSEGGVSYLERMYQRAMYNAQLSWEIDQLQPYIDEELKKPEYEGKSIDELRPAGDTTVFTGWEIIPGSPIDTLLKNARAAKNAAGAETQQPAFYENILTSAYLPLLNSKPFNEIMRLSKRDFVEDTGRNAAEYIDREYAFTIKKFNEIQGGFSTSAKKILNTAVLYLTRDNFYRSNQGRVNPTVYIPLVDYGKACGYDLEPRKMDTPEEQAAEDKRIQGRLKDLKKSIQQDLHDISNFVWSANLKTGNGAGDYKELRIISSHSIIKGVIKINFDVETAAFLNKSYLMQYPLALLKIDNRNPNAYSIGYKIALHNSIDNNFAAGTNNTLSVVKLLESAPQIPTKGELDEKGQRNWKEKIKRPLETSLNTLIEKEYLKRWEYRNPKTGEVFTPEQANNLIWDQFITLLVDFELVQEPEQEGRRERRTAEARENLRKATSKNRGSKAGEKTKGGS